MENSSTPFRSRLRRILARLLRELAEWLAIILGVGAALYFLVLPYALRKIDEIFPEGEGAQMINLDRMQPCGFMPPKKKGKKPERIWCGVSDDFVGPIQDPRKVK